MVEVINFDGAELKERIKKAGLKLKDVSLCINKDASYVSSCCRRGSMSVEAYSEIDILLGNDEEFMNKPIFDNQADPEGYVYTTTGKFLGEKVQTGSREKTWDDFKKHIERNIWNVNKRYSELDRMTNRLTVINDDRARVLEKYLKWLLFSGRDTVLWAEIIDIIVNIEAGNIPVYECSWVKEVKE